MHTISQSVFLQSLGWAILQSIWQVAMLWLVYFVIGRSFLAKQAKARFVLGTFLLSLASFWFVATFVKGMILGSPTPIFFYREEFAVWVNDLSPILSIAYLVLLTAGILRFIRGVQYVNAIRRQGVSRIPVEWRLFTFKTSAVLNIRRKIEIWMSELVESPVTVGFLKPVILIPVSMVNNLSVDQLESIIVHELAHIKRNDFLVNLCLTVGETLLFYHPFARLLGKHIRRDREYICDDTVLQFRYAPELYATALLQAERLRISRAQSVMVVAALSEKNALIDRVNRLFGQKGKTDKRYVGFAAFALLLLFFSTLLPRNPQIFTAPSFVANALTSIESESVSASEDSLKLYSVYSILESRQHSKSRGSGVNEEHSDEISSKDVHSDSSSAAEPDAAMAMAEYEVPAILIPMDELPDPASDMSLVSGRVMMLNIDGENVAVSTDSLAKVIYVNELMLRQAGQRLVAKAIEKELIAKIDWELVANAQTKGIEANIIIREEIARIAMEEEWKKLQQLADSTAEMPHAGIKSSDLISVKKVKDSTETHVRTVSKTRTIVRL